MAGLMRTLLTQNDKKFSLVLHGAFKRCQTLIKHLKELLPTTCFPMLKPYIQIKVK